ncbi:hypothetical protein IAQ61_009969 [Plenodomus lingam]|uniref:uncharacterized protein n=1 Tax=Leptosphaeria maculans TaxID=5022 RepID=UPI0033215094|nr:hypothetical protein IAQ61_009969 [Plenodomus lingam]
MDACTRTFRWTRELPQLGGFEHACLKIYPHGKAGSGVVYLTADANPDNVGSQTTVFGFRALAISPEQTATSKSSDSFVVDDTLSLTIDKTAWPPDTDWSSVKDPTDGGTIKLGTYTTPDGYSVPTARMPSLDDVQTKVNQAMGRKIEQLYRCVSTISAAGNPVHTVELNRAAWLPFLADGGTSESNFGLEFQSNLGIDAKVPCLFQEFQIEQDLFWPEASKAVIFEYNPVMRGMKGDWHFVTMGYARSKMDHFNALRSKSHDASQKIVTKAMFYHMNQDDREKFTNSSKPTDLPSSLADGLKPGLKTFLRTKYAPAYLCQSFEASDDYRGTFTEKEGEKLWYW